MMRSRVNVMSLQQVQHRLMVRSRTLSLTAPAAVHVDLRSLPGGDDPLRLPRPGGSDGVELVLQHRSGFGDGGSGVAPSGGLGLGRGPQQDPADRFHQSPSSFSERHDGETWFKDKWRSDDRRGARGRRANQTAESATGGSSRPIGFEGVFPSINCSRVKSYFNFIYSSKTTRFLVKG